MTQGPARAAQYIREEHLQRATHLLADMTLEEKLGQMHQVNGADGHVPDDLAEAIRCGHVGSVINEVDRQTVQQLQHIARSESRLGIPLLIGRDVIHGFHSVFPIPLGLAASWCEQTLQQAARISAQEASSVGINWTFSPMIDIARDPRWGRIAESFGEDPLLTSVLGQAMVRGYQHADLAEPTAIAACAKHYAGYGASESGRDYNTTNLSQHDMRDIHLPPFRAACAEGVASVMTSFSDINGLPASANDWLLRDVLREQWHYGGMVVSDWESIAHLTIHGIAEDRADAARQALLAGVDMEMVSGTYIQHAAGLVAEKAVPPDLIDQSVLRILALKFALGLFDQDNTSAELPTLTKDNLHAAKQAALRSCVLLKNDQATLPLNKEQLNRVALLGPLSDDGYEQLGTWIFDGREEASVTLRQAMEKQAEAGFVVDTLPVLPTARSVDSGAFPEAVALASAADVAILCLGEEAILSGEAHCRAELNLPGAQEALVAAVAETGTPIVLVIMAGRPLTIEHLLPKVDAVLYAWHPGSMGGEAIAELLMGEVSPSGKLPVTFVRKVGQIPMYYAQKPTGKPVTTETYVSQEDYPVRAPQTSLGMASFHLDAHFTPLFPFGFGLSYSKFEYGPPVLSADELAVTDILKIRFDLRNVGPGDATEVVQLYVRDVVASLTRPIKQLKGFKRVALRAGETAEVEFELPIRELAFYQRDGAERVEPGEFRLGIGGDSTAFLDAVFRVVTS